jgi:hypothetical protein
MNTSFEIGIKGLGFQQKSYPGAYTPTVEKSISQMFDRIQKTSSSPIRVLHLFSGISLIGDIRVDIERPEATHRADVLDFIGGCDDFFDVILLDPPYDLKRESKLVSGEYVSEDIGGYGKTSSVAADVELRRALIDFFRDHTDNIIWLDMCAPFPNKLKEVGFQRKRLEFLFPGGFHTLRVLTWLTKNLQLQKTTSRIFWKYSEIMGKLIAFIENSEEKEVYALLLFLEQTLFPVLEVMKKRANYSGENDDLIRRKVNDIMEKVIGKSLKDLILNE